MKVKQSTKEDDAGNSSSSSLFTEPLFSPQLSRIWGPTSASSPTWLAGSGDNQWLLPATSTAHLPDHLARGILTGAKQCGLNTGQFPAKKGSTGDATWEEEDVMEKEGAQEDVVDSDYKFGPSILWLDQVNSYEENNCTVEIGKGYLDGVLTHEFLMQRHGQVVNCACGHNVDALKVAKQGVSLAKDIQSLFICSPVTIVMHRHCIRVLTPCTELSLHELMTSRRNLREGLEEHARFLAACLVEATSFLHARNILHRDVAPHNVFIDHRGYAKLANFHHAVCGAPGQYFKGYCGTLGYQAPEVVACLGHMHTLDYWGIGTVVYQFLFGFSPFADEDLGRLRSKTVLNPEFAITRLGNRFRHVSHHGQEAIKSMLCKYPHKRLGYRYQEANKMKWFHPYRWSSLARQQMVSPLTSFLEEELETTKSTSFHTPATRSMSNPEMERPWEMMQPSVAWQQQQQQQQQQQHTSPSSSASNCSSQLDDNNSSSTSSSNRVLFQKVFGRAPGDNQGLTHGDMPEDGEKYLSERPEKELCGKTLESQAQDNMANHQAHFDEDASISKSLKNADNFDKQSSNNKGYLPGNFANSEARKKVPDPNSPPFVPSQLSGAAAENYINAHIYAAAHLLQYGNTGFGWNQAGLTQDQRAGVPQQQHNIGQTYAQQFASSRWNPAEGDGINHHNQPANQPAMKIQIQNAAQNWLLKNTCQNDLPTSISECAKRFTASFARSQSSGSSSDAPFQTGAQHSSCYTAGSASQNGFQADCQQDSGQSTKAQKDSENRSQDWLLAENLNDSSAATNRAPSGFQTGVLQMLKKSSDEYNNGDEQHEKECSDQAGDTSCIMPKGKILRYIQTAPRFAPRFYNENP